MPPLRRASNEIRRSPVSSLCRDRRSSHAARITGFAVALIGMAGPPPGHAQVGPPVVRGTDAPRFTLEDVVRTPRYGQFALSSDGTRAVYTMVGTRYFSHPVIPFSGEEGNLRMVSLQTGEIVLLTSGISPKTSPLFSPDGTKVLFEAEDDLWSVRVKDGTARRLTTDQARDGGAAWSPDGRRIAFVSSRPGWSGPETRLPIGSRGRRIWIMDPRGEHQALRQPHPRAHRSERLVLVPGGRPDPARRQRGALLLEADLGRAVRRWPAPDASRLTTTAGTRCRAGLPMGPRSPTCPTDPATGLCG